MANGELYNQMVVGAEWLECSTEKLLTLVGTQYLGITILDRVDLRELLGVTDFTVTRERSEAITFAMPITQIYFSLFIKNPVGTYNFLAYMIPLHNLSWVGIAIFALIVPVFLYMSVR